MPPDPLVAPVAAVLLKGEFVLVELIEAVAAIDIPLFGLVFPTDTPHVLDASVERVWDPLESPLDVAGNGDCQHDGCVDPVGAGAPVPTALLTTVQDLPPSRFECGQDRWSPRFTTIVLQTLDGPLELHELVVPDRVLPTTVTKEHN
jgi:hypothetical protein